MKTVGDLQAMHALLSHWLDWNAKQRADEGLPTDDETKVIVVPTNWPTRGALQDMVNTLDWAIDRIGPAEHGGQVRLAVPLLSDDPELAALGACVHLLWERGYGIGPLAPRLSANQVFRIARYLAQRAGVDLAQGVKA